MLAEVSAGSGRLHEHLKWDKAAVSQQLSAPLCVQTDLCASLYNAFHLLRRSKIWETTPDRKGFFILGGVDLSEK